MHFCDFGEHDHAEREGSEENYFANEGCCGVIACIEFAEVVFDKEEVEAVIEC